MTQEAAIYEARKRIKRDGGKHGLYIVWSPEAHDCPSHHYHPCDEMDLDTFYFGAGVVFYVECDGEVQS